MTELFEFDSEAEEDEFSSEFSEQSEKDNTASNSYKARSEKNMTQNFLQGMSKILESLISENKKSEEYERMVKSQKNQIFSSKHIPKVDLLYYLNRIYNYSNVEKSTLIISLMFIDKICDNSGVYLTEYNIHRLLFAAILIAIKYNEDSFYDNKYYSKIAGVQNSELNEMEYTFLEMSKCSLFVELDKYDSYMRYLDKYNKNN